MGKSRSFSIYLLKVGNDESNALKDDHHLDDAVQAGALPNGASLFVLDNPPREPWWKSYFNVRKVLNQVSKGALVFIPVGNRCFVLSFGHVFHNLKEASYEYDFGLRVTLNSVDPNKLKSTDILEPGPARRQRTQLPIHSDLTYFDFDRDSTILKSITGRVKTEYVELIKHVTGASSLRISSDVDPEQLSELCERLLELYESETYKETFPDIQNVTPVRDPTLVEELNINLLVAVKNKREDISLTVPDIVDYRDNSWIMFSGAGQSLIYDDVFMDLYYEYLEDRKRDLRDITLQDLRKHTLRLTDEDGVVRQSYSIYKSLVFDTSVTGQMGTYHLTEGNWYKIEDKYVSKIKSFLDPLCVNLPLPPYNMKGEGLYNKSVAEADPEYICLDKTNISPMGQTQIEPCDIYSASDGRGLFYHIKISTVSVQLSHQFNQGVNAAELLKLEQEAADKLKALIKKRAKKAVQNFLDPIENQKFGVIFGIVTHKDKKFKSTNLPLFSRISLMRNMRALRLMDVSGAYGYIKDDSAGVKKKKKSRKKKK